MSERNFVIGAAYAKTDALQVAIFSSLVLHEFPVPAVAAGIVLATVGVFVLSLAHAPRGVVWFNRAAAYGLASGAAFAISALGYRAAALQLANSSPWIAGAWGVVLAQALQCLVLVPILGMTQPRSLVLMMREWRSALLAGVAGATASTGWFTAFALTSATNVRALGMTELIFSYVLSWRFLGEKVSAREKVGYILVVCGVLAICVR